MFSEYHEINYSDDIVLVILIVIVQVFQNLKLHTCLILKLLFVSYNLDSY